MGDIIMEDVILSNNDKKVRIKRIDMLKGIAIISIFLYHFGGEILPFGFLGVEVFLVISGYLMIKGLIKQFQTNTFNYWKYITNKILRLLPLILIMSFISYIIGYFTLLPDAYKILSKHSVASCLFAKNILSDITANNYWNSLNIFDPFLHLWYVSLLMQAYVILPLIFQLFYKIIKGNMNAFMIFIIILSSFSFILYLLPNISDSNKFYYLQYRLFELTLGGLLVFVNRDFIMNSKELITNNKTKRYLVLIENIILSIILLLMICLNINFNNQIRLLSVVVCTMLLLFNIIRTNEKDNFIISFFAIIGKCSYSIYVSHQVIIALMFTIFGDLPLPLLFFIILFITIVTSLVLYNFVEKPISKFSIDKFPLKNKIIYGLSFIAIWGGIGLYGGIVFLNSGVTRDVPELNIIKKEYLFNISKKTYSELFYDYVDKPYDWNKDFTDNDKKKILVLGNSFGRDWANILSETSFRDQMEISYLFPYSEQDIKDHLSRIKHADYVFFAVELGYFDYEYCVPDYYFDYIDKDKLYIISDKNYGSNPNQIYRKRHNKNYYNSTINMKKVDIERNEKLKNHFGNKYIDIMGAVKSSDNSFRVFTSDNKFISWDGRHLTPFGTKYYAQILDLSWIVE